MSTTLLKIPTNPTWDELVRREPQLAVLRSSVEQVTAEDGHPFCANAVWYGYHGEPGIKPKLVRLVGFRAESTDPAIRSEDIPNEPSRLARRGETRACLQS